VWSKITRGSEEIVELMIEELRASYHVLTADPWIQPGDKVSISS
jgi:hypothetical protein